MTNLAESRRDLERYITARVPVIGIRTIEQPRALQLLKDIALTSKRAHLPFSIYTRATGLRDLRTGSPLTDDRSLTGAMEFAAGQFGTRAQASVIFVEPDDLTGDSSFTRHMAELARLANENGGSITLVTDSPIWSPLSRLGMTVTLDVPDSEEMYTTIVGFLSDHNGLVPIAWTEDDARRAAEMLVGVTEGEAINLMATIVAKGSVDKDDVTYLAHCKDQIFGDLAGLERVHLKDTDSSIGGLTNLREWLHRRKQLMMADLRGTELRPPRGVLLVGVPGCGKSLSAKAIAAEWQLPLYRLDLAGILGMYVGQSEGRLREALDTADRVSPCVLWIDEIEKGLAGQNDSSGVGKRMVGQFLFWLQESSSKSFVVATANDVRSLPPELLRKGRFDELFFVDLPTDTEREEIIRLYLRLYVKTDVDADLVSKMVVLADGFAGSDIESVLQDVGAEMHLNKRTEIDSDFIINAFTNTVPYSQTNPEQIEEIRAWGRDRAVPAGELPRASNNGSHSGRRVLIMNQ
jgi:hypothetical protein